VEDLRAGLSVRLLACNLSTQFRLLRLLVQWTYHTCLSLLVEEIDQIIKEMPGDKAPAPGGFDALFLNIIA
jgi:hypothetical protein